MQSTDKILFDEPTIQQRVKELAAEISNDYDDLVVIVVLKGAMFFASDLLRHISIKTELDTISLGSYGQQGTKSGAVRLNNDITVDIEGRHVIFVEDIIDTGFTMRYLSGLFSFRNPASIKICSLLSKPSKRKTASIYVERDGTVSILVPESLSKKQIDDLIESKRRWIYRNLAEWQDLNAARVRRDPAGCGNHRLR